MIYIILGIGVALAIIDQFTGKRIRKLGWVPLTCIFFLMFLLSSMFYKS